MATCVKTVLIFCLSCVLLIIPFGCSNSEDSLTKVGDFWVRESPLYEVDLKPPAVKETMNGIEIHRREAWIVPKGPDYCCVSVDCYQDVNLNDAIAYIEEWPSSVNKEGQKFPDAFYNPYLPEIRVTQTEATSLPDGTEAYFWTLRSEDGAARFFVKKTIVFQVNEDSLGVLSFAASDTEMYETGQPIFDEVVKNIVI